GLRMAVSEIPGRVAGDLAVRGGVGKQTRQTARQSLQDGKAEPFLGPRGADERVGVPIGPGHPGGVECQMVLVDQSALLFFGSRRLCRDAAKTELAAARPPDAQSFHRDVDSLHDTFVLAHEQQRGRSSSAPLGGGTERTRIKRLSDFNGSTETLAPELFCQDLGDRELARWLAVSLLDFFPNRRIEGKVALISLAQVKNGAARSLQRRRDRGPERSDT